MTIRAHHHLGPASNPACGRAPITGNGFVACHGRPHPATLPIRVDDAMAAAEKYSPAWYDARTSWFDANAALNLHYGRTPDELSPLTGFLAKEARR